MTKKAKGITCGVIGVAALSSIFASDNKIESIELSVPDYQIEYDLNTKISVEITFSPTDADTKSIEYITSDDSIKFSDSGILTGDVEGTFDVYVVVDDITSNIISINVVDITAREYAMAKSEAQQNDGEQPQDQTSFENQPTAEGPTTSESEIPENGESALENNGANPQTSIEQLAENNETNQQGSSAQSSVEEHLNGNIEEQQVPDQEADPQTTVEVPIPELTPPAEEPNNSSTSDSSGNNSNFNTYNNASQQQTEFTYVLNTNTMKIHHPTCSSVKKIAPHNYATSNSTLNELLAQGYSTCGNCFR